MPFVLGEVFSQDETVTKVFSLEGHDTEITYFRNRLTMEDTRREGGPEGDGPEGEEDGDEDGDTADSVAARLVGLVKAWDWTGPLMRLDGSVAVERDAPIPLDAEMVRLIPLRATKALNQAIVEAELGGNARTRRKPSRSAR